MYILFFIKISIQNSPNNLHNFWYKRSATGHAALRCLPTSSHNSTIVLAGMECLHDGALSWWPLAYRVSSYNNWSYSHHLFIIDITTTLNKYKECFKTKPTNAIIIICYKVNHSDSQFKFISHSPPETKIFSLTFWA